MRTWLFALLLLGITTALAQDITNGLRPSGTIQLMQSGLNNPSGSISGGGGGGGSCNGTIDLSQGCPQPMLGL